MSTLFIFNKSIYIFAKLYSKSNLYLEGHLLWDVKKSIEVTK